MQISKESIYNYLIFSSPIVYDDKFTLYPVLMEDILDFSVLKSSILVRKNSWFPVKKVIKMSYLEFLFYCHNNEEFAKEYDMPLLPSYYSFAFALLKLVCRDQEVLANPTRGGFMINGYEITDSEFDDIRRIVILQNGIDFDIDEFINRDTEIALENAKKKTEGKDDYTFEDYIDSVCLAMGLSEQEVRKMSIRKFWRFVKRISKRDIFNILKSAESSGMVKFKQPIEYWMTDIEDGDKYKDVKTDSSSLRKMISG